MKQLGVILSLSSLAALTVKPEKKELYTEITREFIQNVSETVRFEVVTSEAALDKSNDPEVRAFAQMIIDDHATVNHQLEEMVAGTPLASNLQSKLNIRHQKIYQILQSSAGKDFDRQYIRAQMGAHQESVNLFREYSRSGDTLSLRDFAQRELPVLENHKMHAEQLRNGGQTQYE